MAAFTYPGVYIEEISSGQHTITGVATSIAAFIGWANQGPVGEAVMVESWSQYQATFGGMIPGVYLGYAVYQFFLNGGSQAYIVRLAWTDAVTATNTIGGLTLYANSPGQWANSINVIVSNVNTTNNTFNLQVTQTNGTQTQTLESYTNLSISPTSSQFAVTVIDSDSNYITFIAPGGTAPTTITLPTATVAAGVTLNGGTSTTKGNDGTTLVPGDGNFETALANTTSGYAVLSSVPIFNLLCVPGETGAGAVGELQSFCATNRAFLIVDSAHTAVVGTGSSGLSNTGPADSTNATLVDQFASNSAFYFPWVLAPDPQVGFRPTLFPPCGFVAGIYASTDASRGVWKAPAGINASLTGALGLQYNLTDQQNGLLNPLGVNCLRQFPTYGNVVWGARTIAGANAAGSQWQYIPIRRLALFLESSLYEGTQWAVFEPNAEPLWGQVRLSIGTFMQGLFLQGAFAGTTPQQAYFVKCDGDNNPDATVAMGILNITVGFAPLYPAEFVVIQIQQMMNQS
jgi:phage tail sheath protein FI